MKAVLWDLDGTLVDSEEYHWLAWQQTMRAEGIELTREQFQKSFGQRNDSFLPAWLGPGAAPERVRRVADAKEDRYRHMVLERGIEPLPGAAAWINRLHGAGWLQAIASSAPRANLDTILHALTLNDAFEATVAAEDVSHGKPDPEVFLTAASKLNVAPERCIVVEDAAAGIEAARGAHMRTIGIGVAADLTVTSLPNLSIDDFDRLLAGA